MKKMLLLMLGCCVQLSVIAQAVIKNTTPRKQHTTAHHKAQPAVKWKHSNTTTTVAKDDHAAYEGKPSQSNDGVNKNKQRNINANVPTNLAPINGNGAK